MKLSEAVIMGRFMGLETVEEAVHNAELHYFQCISYEEVPKERQELLQEYHYWSEGALELDWNHINKEVKKQITEMEKYFEENPPEDVDFSCLD